jgi:hypothetical protein
MSAPADLLAESYAEDVVPGVFSSEHELAAQLIPALGPPAVAHHHPRDAVRHESALHDLGPLSGGGGHFPRPRGTRMLRASLGHEQKWTRRRSSAAGTSPLRRKSLDELGGGDPSGF